MNYDQEKSSADETFITPQAIQKMIQETMQSTLPGAIFSAFSVAGLSGKGINSDTWYLDYVAFNHMSRQKQAFSEIKSCSLNQSITTANGRKLPIKGVGTVLLTNAYKIFSLC